MEEEVQLLLEEMKESMDKAITHAQNEFAKIRAGKAHPSMLDSVSVDYYGSMVPLSQVSNINTPDARSLIVQPWEKAMLQPIEKAIRDANLGFNPQNDAELIRINIPPLTEERRKDLVKKVKSEGENAKVSIRNIRKDINDQLRKLLKEGLPEDSEKDAEAQVQKTTDAYVGKIDTLYAQKEADILKV